MHIRRLLLYDLVVLVSSFLFASNVNASMGPMKKFYVEKYGAVGDGKTNDIAAFQSLSRDLNANGGGIVVFPHERVFSISILDDYSCGHKATPDDGAMAFNFEHCKRVVVDMNGSTIRLTPNHSTKYSFFRFFDCTSFSLSNGILIGDAVEHDYSPVMYKGKEEKTSHQWGYGVYIRGSKGEIINMDITRMIGDGVYGGSVKLKDDIYHAKTEIRNCEISFCRRHGISCTSSLGFTISHSKIHHIGSWKKDSDMPVAVTGCTPSAGIDFEYEGKAGDIGPILIAECTFSDCSKYCIVTSNSSRPETSSFMIMNCVFKGAMVHTNNLKSRDKKVVSNCSFLKASSFFGDATVTDCVFDMGVNVNYISKTVFNNCSFNGNLELVDSKHGCFMAGTNDGPTVFNNCTFKNIRGYNDNTPAYQGFSGYVHPISIRFNNCVFDNCSFVVSKKKYDSRLSFSGCTLKNGCLIHNLSTEAMCFYNSELYDVESYVTQNGVFIMNNCKIVQENESIARPLLSFGTHTLNKCTVIDKVGIPSNNMRRYGVKGYRVEAKDSDILLDSKKIVTKGLSLNGGSLSGVKLDEFQGIQEKTVFK